MRVPLQINDCKPAFMLIALGVGAQGLSGCALRFTGPSAPLIPDAPSAPRAPTPETKPQPIDPPRSKEVAGLLNRRTLRNAKLGLMGLEAPSSKVNAREVYADLLYRLMKNRRLKVVDLSGAREIHAILERTSSGQRHTYDGSLDRMLWVGTMVPTRLIVVMEPLRLWSGTKKIPHVYEYGPGTVEAYQTDYARWNQTCEKTKQETAAAMQEYQAAWTEAEVNYKSSLPWWSLIGLEYEYRDARRTFERWQSDAASVVQACRVGLPDPEQLALRHGEVAAPTETSTHVGELRFRILEVPGGHVVYTGRLRSEATQVSAVLNQLITDFVAVLSGEKR